MDHYFWFALKSIPLVGNVTFCRLLHHFETPEQVFKASEEELAAIRGLSPAVAEQIKNHDYREFADKESAALLRSGVRIVDFLSAEYPKILLEIPDFPPYLYVRGSLRSAECCIAMVGSRRASSSGQGITERLARDLALNGITVVSGLARGIDTSAHRGALKGGGRTIGVLGSGLNICYPPENHKLFDEIAAQGGVISEFPLGTAPLADNFPRRNRIISGLSRGVVVVEAVENSGSLITARFALEQGREVFAVPGNINYPGSRGPNRLIKEGAVLTETVDDIIVNLPNHTMSPVGTPAAAPSFTLTPQEASIYTLLANAPLHADEIIVKCGLTAGEVSAMLLRLELKGAVTRLPGSYFMIS
jgi:DNA processing protein